MKKIVTPYMEAKIHKLTKEGLGPTIIGQRLGLGKTTVCRVLKDSVLAKQKQASAIAERVTT